MQHRAGQPRQPKPSTPRSIKYCPPVRKNPRAWKWRDDGLSPSRQTSLAFGVWLVAYVGVPRCGGFACRWFNALKNGALSMAVLTQSIPDCPKCQQSKLKLITARASSPRSKAKGVRDDATKKKTGKKYWVCASGREVCDAIYGDKKGKLDLHRSRQAKHGQKGSASCFAASTGARLAPRRAGCRW